MADSRISNLPTSGTVTGTSAIPYSEAGTTYSCVPGDILNEIKNIDSSGTLTGTSLIPFSDSGTTNTNTVLQAWNTLGALGTQNTGTSDIYVFNRSGTTYQCNPAQLAYPVIGAVYDLDEITTMGSTYYVGIAGPTKVGYKIPYPSLINANGWILVNPSDSWNYISGTSVGIASGGTANYSVGDKIMFSQGGTTKYFYSLGRSGTILSLTGGSDYAVENAAISGIYHSKTVSPVNFPQWFNYVPSLTNLSGGTIDVAQFSVIGKTTYIRFQYSLGGAGVAGEVSVSIPITVTAPLISDSIGQVVYRDTGSALYNGIVLLGTSTVVLKAINSAGTYSSMVSLSSSIPHTWASTDTIMFEAIYRID